MNIPFLSRFFQNKPLSIEQLSEERFNAEIEKGMADLKNGKVVPAEQVSDRMSKYYGI